MKVCWPLVFLLLIIYIISEPPVLHADTQLPRHTPGFPEPINVSLVEELMKTLQMLNTTLNNVDALSKLQNSPGSGRQIYEALDELARSGVLSPSIVEASGILLSSSSSVEDLAGMIKNQELRGLIYKLADLYNRIGSLESEELMKAIDQVRASRMAGYISDEDYMLALEALKRLAERSGKVDIAGLLDRDILNSLKDMIADPELREMLSRLVKQYIEAGYIQYKDLVNVLNMLRTDYISGRVNYRDYMLALDALKKMAESSGEVDMAKLLDKELLDILKDIIRGIKDIGPMIPPNLSTGIFSGSTIQSLPYMLEGFSSVEAAQASFPRIAFTTMQSFPLVSLLIPIGIIATAVILALLAPRMLHQLKKASSRMSAPEPASVDIPESLPKPIKLYWSSVGRVAMITRIVKRDVQTHREYLRDVNDKLGRLSQHFKEVTYCYEVARFGGISDPEIERRAEEAYNRLVQGQ
ncbi:MAG: DUF4129 domain-containing protein [Sulfolobales archaeon]